MSDTEDKNIAEELPQDNELFFENEYVKVVLLNNEKTLICQAVDMFIPEEQFTKIFQDIGEYVKTHPIGKVIFDKRSLKIFDQNAMVWYHIVFKKDLLAYGMTTWRKLLPNDSTFKLSVNLGKDKIKTKYPDFDFDLFDIQYVESFEEALKN